MCRFPRATAIALICASFASAHQYVVHRDMTDLAYEIMIMVSKDLATPPSDRLISGGAGHVSPADWEKFLRDVDSARNKIRSLRTGLQNAKRGDCAGQTVVMDTGWAFNLPLSKLPRPVALNWFTGNDCGVDFSGLRREAFTLKTTMQLPRSTIPASFWASGRRALTIMWTTPISGSSPLVWQESAPRQLRRIS